MNLLNNSQILDKLSDGTIQGHGAEKELLQMSHIHQSIKGEDFVIKKTMTYRYINCVYCGSITPDLQDKENQYSDLDFFKQVNEAYS